MQRLGFPGLELAGFVQPGACARMVFLDQPTYINVGSLFSLQIWGILVQRTCHVPVANAAPSLKYAE